VTGKWAKVAVFVALVVAVAVGLAACGGSSTSSGTTAASTGSSGSKEGGGESNEGGGEGKEGGGGSKSSGGNDVRSFGKEAGAAEREAASQALEAFMAARAAGKWSVECKYTGKPAIQAIKEFVNPKYRHKSCAELLSALSEVQPKEALENNLEAPIDQLRIKGGETFAIYRGTGGGEYAIAMVREGGEWKVATVTSTEIPPAE
jgi:hypothetical protein